MPKEQLLSAGAARVLLVGTPFTTRDRFVSSSSAPHYDVRVFDPFEGFPESNACSGRIWAGRVNVALRPRTAFPEGAAGHLRASTAPGRGGLRPGPGIGDRDGVDPPADRGRPESGNRGGSHHRRLLDAITKLRRGYFFAADYDRLAFKDHYIVDKLRTKLGWKHVFYLPQGCDRVLHRQVALTEEDLLCYRCEITLAGNPHLYRCEFLRPLLGRDLKIWGASPPAWLDHPTRSFYTGRYVAGDDKCKAMLSASIVLNQNHYAEIAGTNKRTFEVAAIGAFQLTDTPALADVFDPETEVACFDTQQEMLDRIEYYLARPELRAAMAERARLRAHAEHTYEHRWVALLETLGLEPPPDFPVRAGTLAVRAV